MSQENVEIVRRYYEDIGRGDHAAALRCLAPDVVFTVTQEGTVHGRKAIRAMGARPRKRHALVKETRRQVKSGLSLLNHPSRLSGGG